MKFYGIIGISILLLASCGNYQKPLDNASPLVRVLLYEGGEIKINSSQKYVLDANSRRTVIEGTVYLSIADDRIEVNGTPISGNNVELFPNQYFEFQGKKYQGSARIILTNNRLMLINSIDIESYLYGVLPNEVSPGWDIQALKAQAVVSRTFALYEVASSRKSGRIFDLYDDTRSQVYNGIDEESRQTSIAVDATMGEVMKYQGKIIQTFFHAASGGMTESAGEVFGEDKPYLRAVESPYSGLYKDNKWEVSVTIKQIADGLKISNDITAIRIIERTASKRIKKVEITDAMNHRVDILGKDFRNIVGSSAMKSVRANIKITNDSILISGMGYGHGVGMGQWDALGMAKQGFQYRDILTYFYRGAVLDKIW